MTNTVIFYFFMAGALTWICMLAIAFFVDKNELEIKELKREIKKLSKGK